MTDLYPPIDPPKHGSEATIGPLWTFEAVQERLVEAMRLWWRMPDRERGWLTVRAMWPDIRREKLFGDGDGLRNEKSVPEEPRPLPLTRDQVAEMTAVAEWIAAYVPERDGQLVGLALAQLASGRKQVRWSKVKARLSADITPRGLGMRYRRAIAAIAQGLNSLKKEGDGVSRVMVHRE